MSSARVGALRLAAVAVALLAVVPTAPSRAADAGHKTLRVAFSIAETSFDPAFASDAASDSIIANMFEAMLDYDYLARPVKLVPRTLEALPKVEDGGRTYVARLRKGIYFTPHPAFKGQRRELTAADYAYSFKRHLDPVRSRHGRGCSKASSSAATRRRSARARPASSTTTRRCRASKSSTATRCGSA